MINEGNSLAELQARVLRASQHEKKFETTSTVRLGAYRTTNLSAGKLIHQMNWAAMSDKLDAWAYTMMAIKSLPTSSSPKASPKATSAAGSRLAGRRADLIILDDLIS